MSPVIYATVLVDYCAMANDLLLKLTQSVDEILQQTLKH